MHNETWHPNDAMDEQYSSTGWESLEKLNNDPTIQYHLRKLDNALAEGSLYSDKEVLKGDYCDAQDFLPYITLDELSDHEKADVLRLADYAKYRDRSKRDSFDFYNDYSYCLAEIVGDSQEYHDGTVSKKVQEARKLFCANILDASTKVSPRQQIDFYQAFFSSSPSFNSYCGDLADEIELLEIAGRANNNPCANALLQEMIYEYSFSDENEFRDTLENSSPIQQLRLMSTMGGMLFYTFGDSYAETFVNKIFQSFASMSESPDTTPLVRYVAEGLLEGYELPYGEDEDSIIEQEVLRKEFPGLADRFDLPGYFEPSLLVRIAPDTAATINYQGQIDLIAKNATTSVSALKYRENNTFGLSFDEVVLLSTAHQPNVKSVVRDKVGIELSAISLPAQIQLLKFMTEASDAKFDFLCTTLQNMDDEDSRLQFAENFSLLRDFGDDFGDDLLEMANSDNMSEKQLQKMLEQISSCRDSIGQIAKLYEDFDNGKFQREYMRAASERLADAVAVFAEIARNETARADLGHFGIVEFNYKTAMEALAYEAKSLEIIAGTTNALQNKEVGAFAEKILTPDEKQQRSLYSFYAPAYGYTLLYTRPEGAGVFNSMLEYGKSKSRYSANAENSGVEASISFTVNPINPFSLPNPFRPNTKKARDTLYYDSTKMDKVSALRLDREGRIPGASAFDISRDPINPFGMVSVDLAAINDRPDTPSGKIARLFSAGGRLRTNSDEDFALNHNTKWFDQNTYGTEKGFQALVEYLDKIANTWCAAMPPKSDEGFVGAKRKLRQKIGKRALSMFS